MKTQVTIEIMYITSEMVSINSCHTIENHTVEKSSLVSVGTSLMIHLGSKNMISRTNQSCVITDVYIEAVLNFSSRLHEV